uniref:Uncharacterized protein n=1 Tax=Acrobeloides nanus TaxID=290746 RepID=A0A914DT36_9BILA
MSSNEYALSDNERRAIIVALGKLMKQHMPSYNIIYKFRTRCKGLSTIHEEDEHYWHIESQNCYCLNMKLCSTCKK